MGLMDIKSLVAPHLVGRGEKVTATLAVLGGSLLLAGTSSGNVIACAITDGLAGLAGTLVFAQRVHAGAVHDISLSSSQLVATAGHDAACVVFPLSEVFRGGPAAAGSGPSQVQLLRLAGHQLPVLSVAFFSDGCTLASLGVDGRLIVFDVLSGSQVCHVHCGFPARTLALSADESHCFVAGKMLARVDLLHALRAVVEERRTGPYQLRASPGAVNAAPQPWLRLCGWDPLPGAPRDTPRPAVSHRTGRGVFIGQLHVASADGSLAALFSERAPSGSATVDRPVAVATWRFSSPTPLAADELTVLTSASDAPALLSSCAGVPVSGAEQLNRLGWAAVAAYVRQKHALAAPGKEDGRVVKARRLEEVTARQQALQSECDLLATRLREAVGQRKVKA